MKNLILGLVWVFSFSVIADLKYAPPAFEWKPGQKAVPIDIHEYRLTMDFYPDDRVLSAVARIDFRVGEEGYPFLDFVGEAGDVKINGFETTSLGDAAVAGGPIKLVEVADPDRVTRLKVLNTKLQPGKLHQMVVRYGRRNNERVTFENGGVQFVTAMTDFGDQGRGFLERYAPANLEFDQYPLILHLKVHTDEPHQFFANGDTEKMGDNEWMVRFPDWYSASSFFFHVSNRDFKIVTADFNGLKGTIPVTAYSTRRSIPDGAVKSALDILAELERDYGAFTHEQMLMLMTAGGGGMEHAGATITSMWALGHEIFHSYFARGVMPSNGSAGWIDEGAARFRDDGYPTAGWPPRRNRMKLAGFSPYRRHTARGSYRWGAQFMSELDHLLKGKGGMKAALRELFTRYQRQVISAEDFQRFMNEFAQEDLGSYFDRYIYGKDRSPTWALAQACGIALTAPKPFSLDNIRGQY